tara:strand:- start:3097 stop:3837 length:741 start_codon:yes stop_codon:yes gene_type:complete
MVKLPVYFVSDNHFKFDIDDSEKNRRKKFYFLCDKIESSGGTLVLGGDFFDFWFNYEHVIPSGYSDIVERLSILNQSGISIHYVLGNHDYWDFGYFHKKFNAKIYKGNLEFQHNECKIQVTHGDGLLKNDYGYRIMRKIIRSNLCISLFKKFHPDWGCALAKKTSHISGNYNHHDLNKENNRKELIEYARSQWALGFKTILIGHYHQVGIHEEDGNNIIFMGDWIKHFTVTKLDDNGWWQGNWDQI